MRNRPQTWALVAASLALTAAFAIFFESHVTQLIAARDTQSIVVSAAYAATAPAAETSPIAPADVLGTGVVSWAPLTGDGAN